MLERLQTLSNNNNIIIENNNLFFWHANIVFTKHLSACFNKTGNLTKAPWKKHRGGCARYVNKWCKI